MTTREAQLCSHCGLRFNWRPVTVDEAEGAGALFCCRGCLGAWRLIRGAGLADFYQRAGGAVPTVDEESLCGFSEQELAGYLIPEGETVRIDLLITNITCPACVWLLERIVGAQPGVLGVSLSYTARVASVRLHPADCRPSELLQTISRLGYHPRPYTPDLSEQEARREKHDLLIRFGTALFLTMQLMAYSIALYAGYFQGISPALRQQLQYISAVVTAPVVFYCGWPFLRGAWTGVRSRMPGMDLLIATGALSAFAYSCYAMLEGGETYFESAAMIVTFVLVGRLLELVVRRKAVAGLEGLLSSVPRFAVRLGADGPTEVAIDQVQPGELLLIRQGERVPLDGTLQEGSSEFDESAVTGESLPALKEPGDEVRGGSLNLVAPVTLRADRPAATSFIMRVAGMVRESQSRKPPVQRVADRISSVFVPLVVLLAGIVGFVDWWYLEYESGRAIAVALSVILIACPCALGLAVPSAVLAACSRAAAHGILLRGGDAIERLAAVTCAAFDKTGTLTEGRPEVAACCPAPGCTEDALLEVAAALEQGDAHPLARSIARYARRRIGETALAGQLVVRPGRGVAGLLPDGSLALCGNLRQMQEHGVAMVPGVCGVPLAHETLVYVARNGRLLGYLALRDRLRSGATSALSGLRTDGVTTHLLSGDRREVVQRLAEELSIGEPGFELTPEDKGAWVGERQRLGERVLMVGDGVNDAPALALATVSCVPSGASDLALEQADLILEGGDIALLAEARDIARRTMRVIRQNLLWAFVYNMIGIPLAVAGLLTPVYAAVAMTASSLMVSLNSLRLLRGPRRG